MRFSVCAAPSTVVSSTAGSGTCSASTAARTAKTSDVILQDAVDSTSFKTASYVGTNLPVSGRRCIDVDFTRPEFLRGNLSQAERDFLFDTRTGRTVYEQTYLEGSLAGNLFELPAGPLGVALRFHVSCDEIVDTPRRVTSALISAAT